MSTITVPDAGRQTFSTPWLFGPRVDLAVSIGGMLAGFALVAMNAVLGWSMLLIWFVWVIVLDTPHFFATYSRTYLDREARTEFGPLLRRSLLIFTLAPAAILLSAVLYAIGYADFRMPWEYLGIAVSLWAYLHITRQHYGFLRLYNRKNGEIGTREARLDALVLYGVLLFTFIGVLTYYPRSLRTMGLSAEAGEVLSLCALVATLALIALFFAFQAGKFLRGDPVNLPKLVFLSTVMTLHGVVSFGDVLPPNTMLGFTAVITIYHDIQYLVFVNYQGKKRYGATPESRQRFGLAGKLSASFPLFIGAGILMMSLPIWGFACMIGRVQVCNVQDWGEASFLGPTSWILFFAAASMSVQMHHYVLDQFIWRPGKNARLRQELELDPARAAG